MPLKFRYSYTLRFISIFPTGPVVIRRSLFPPAPSVLIIFSSRGEARDDASMNVRNLPVARSDLYWNGTGALSTFSRLDELALLFCYVERDAFIKLSVDKLCAIII